MQPARNHIVGVNEVEWKLGNYNYNYLSLKPILMNSYEISMLNE